MSSGYDSLRSGAAYIDLSARGRIRITGEDRVRLLHAMASNHVQQLRPGQGCYTFFLNAQGRILADAVLLAFEDHLLLDTEPETRRFLYEHLDRYIIADDVALEDVTEATVEFSVEGPAATPSAVPPDEPYGHAAWGDRTLVRGGVTGQTGFRVIAPVADRAALVAEFEALGIPPASADDARLVRLENGVPRYGEDMTDRHLPHETQMLGGVHFDKGCYLGQEIVERVRSRGGVHRFLVRVAASQVLEPGAKLSAGGREVGEITSMMFSPRQARAVGLAYVRTAEAAGDLKAGELPVEVTAPKPSPAMGAPLQ